MAFLSSGWHRDPTEDNDPWGYIAPGSVLPRYEIQQIVQVYLRGQLLRGRVVDYGATGPTWLRVRVGHRTYELHMSLLAPLDRPFPR